MYNTPWDGPPQQPQQHYYQPQQPHVAHQPFPQAQPDWPYQQPPAPQQIEQQYGYPQQHDPHFYPIPAQIPHQQQPPHSLAPQNFQMPTTRNTRRGTDSGSEHYQATPSYAPGTEISQRGRVRKAANYRDEPLIPPPSAEELGLRTRSVRPNYKDEDPDFDGEAVDPLATQARPRRRAARPVWQEDEDDDGEFEPDPTADPTLTLNGQNPNNGHIKTEEAIVTHRGRVVPKKTYVESSGDEIGESGPRRLVRKSHNDDFIATDEEDEEEIEGANESYGSIATRLAKRRLLEAKNEELKQKRREERKRNQQQNPRRRRIRNSGSEDDYIEEDDDFEDSLLEEETRRTTPSPSPSDEEGRAYKLRSREGQPTSYNEIAAFEKMEQNGAAKKSKPKKTKLNWTGKDYETAWGPLPGQSDSETDFARTPKKPGVLPATPGSGMLAGGAGLPFDAAGTPSNLGRIGESGLADVDPLGVNVNVSFDDVGGLDEHISKLKEMTLLPLLYPDMFQSLGVTPPRGVLFHGPPGTGKTLVARALAASCRSEGRSVSFFMRKGADCLSKWVGEAERQLRLLFEEAKRSQPSIIFFDEIDGLAPVRSSKQDQIHASIVSTLLALMDGMDGRGQVIVIGATNRPDAIDPALRRPGRFDREFYFPLPNFDARLKILGIMTKPWENWQGEEGEESRKRLAKLTKGYGGADLRALCTEAALNAIQRQYPQIYQSSERLLLDHSKIAVQARDFMISVKEVIPSSARSSTTVAAPLPAHLVPLLEAPLEQVKTALDKALPKLKKRSALEEAQWEEDHPNGEAGAFEREMMLQALETQRINRPRLLLYGESGMGQRAVGAAALHHLEGYTIQNLDLGTLTGDSARTPEAAIVQLFIEAKRHAPSVIYIPSLLALCSALPDSCRALISDTLESLDAHEPIVLLAIMGGSLKSLPRDVKAWFGRTDAGRIGFFPPDESQRRKFFEDLLEYVSKPPNQFPDAVKRRKRILEVLPVAPPLPPREPTAAEIAAQERQDTLLFYKLKGHLSSIFSQCRKADNKFCKATIGQTFGQWKSEDGAWYGHARKLLVAPPKPAANGGGDASNDPQPAGGDGEVAAAPQYEYRRRLLHDVDMARIHDWIWEGRYHTSEEFLRDVQLVKANAEIEKDDDNPTSKEMYRRADKVFGVAQEEVGRTEPNFNYETIRMAERFRAKERRALEEKEKAEKEAAEKQVTEQAVTTAEPDSSILLLGDVGSEERSLKRNREDDEDESMDVDRPMKRVRTSPVPGEAPTVEPKAVRFAGLPAEPNLPAIAVNGTTLDTKMEDSFDPLASPSPAPKAGLLAAHGPLYDASLANVPDVSASKTNSDSTLLISNFAPSGLTQHVIISRTPSPGPSTPPELIVTPSLLASLEDCLATKTANLDVEQLVALRAACLDLVWRRRSEWNRDSLIDAMIEYIHGYLKEMGAESDDD